MFSTIFLLFCYLFSILLLSKVFQTHLKRLQKNHGRYIKIIKTRYKKEKKLKNHFQARSKALENILKKREENNV